MAANNEVLSQFKAGLAERLGKSSVSDLPASDRAIVTIPGDLTLKDAFEILINKQVLSAPVEKAGGEGYVGTLELRYLSNSVVCLHKVQSSKKKEVVKAARADLNDLISQLSNHPHMSAPAMSPAFAANQDNLAIWTAAYVAKISPLRVVSPSSPLADVCKKLASGVRRVAVLGDDGKITRVVSQSWLMDAINAMVKEMGEKECGVPVSALEIKPKPLVACELNKPTIEAFKLLDKHNISGLPLVDSEGHLVGQVTPHDLHNFVKSRDVAQLDKPLKDFLGPQRVSRDAANAYKITNSTSLTTVFAKFADSKSHRLFLVDDSDKVVAVYSLKDVLAAVV